jgi:transcriptional regulator with XRE-family HTH domain
MDLVNEGPPADMEPQEPARKAPLSDLVREQRLQLGLSLREVVERSPVDPKTGESAVKRSWLFALEAAEATLRPPVEAQLAGLAEALELSQQDLVVANTEQFYRTQVVVSDSGDLRMLLAVGERMSPEQLRSWTAAMEAMLPPLD